MSNPFPHLPLLRSWGIEAITEWEALQGNVFRITLGDGTHYVFKAIGAYTETIAQRLHFEHAVLNHVVATGVTAAVPLLTHAGTPYLVDDGQIYRLSVWLPNRMATVATSEEQAQLYQNYGTAIGRFHHALASYQADDLLQQTWQTDLRKRLFDEALPVVRTHLDPAARDAFAAALAPLLPQLEATVDNLPCQLMIWDCHPGNVAVDGLSVSGFIDLDHLAVAPRVLDLGDFLVHLMKWDLDNDAKLQQWLHHLPALLHAYQTVNPLTPAERDALYTAMVAIPLIFLDFFFQGGHSEPTKTELALFHWLAAHRSAVAQALQESW